MTARAASEGARIGQPGRLRNAAWAALSTVRDPELDQAVTDLGFVADLSVDDDGVARARMRLPTYFCAPNFAYLMVADAYDALASVPGIARAVVELVDHFAAEEINAGVAADGGFVGAFPGLADDELADLRKTFARKAHLAAQERLARRLARDGWTVGDLAGTVLGGLPASPDGDRLRRRRADLGLPVWDDAPVFADEHGHPMSAEELPAHLRFAQAVRVSIDGNADWCRGLLGTRYGIGGSTDKEGTA